MTSSLKIFPTAFENYLTIVSNEKTELTIWYLNGQKEYFKISVGHNKINLSHLSNGLYFIGSFKGEILRIIKK